MMRPHGHVIKNVYLLAGALPTSNSHGKSLDDVSTGVCTGVSTGD